MSNPIAVSKGDFYNGGKHGNIWRNAMKDWARTAGVEYPHERWAFFAKTIGATVDNSYLVFATKDDYLLFLLKWGNPKDE